MSETVIVVWVLVVFAVMLNGCAAGVVGVLHAWRSKLGRGGRIMAAAALAALLPTSIFVPTGLMDASLARSEEPLIIAFAFAMIFAVALVVSLPGALIVARKLDAPGDDYRTFE